MECPICYNLLEVGETIEPEKWESSDVESAQISIITIDPSQSHLQNQNQNLHRVRSLSFRPSNHTIQVPVIQCPTRKHDLCNPCMIKWMKNSLEQQKDVNCVICNQQIHSITRYRREVMREQREEAERREAAEVAAAEERLQQIIRRSIERNIEELNGMMGKLCCWAGGGFGLIFIFLLCYPGKTTKVGYFMAVYVGVCGVIMLGLFLNRLFYVSQLNETNRIHPERTVESTRMGDLRSPASSRESSTLPV